LLAAEGLAELRHVRDSAVDPEAGRRVRISLRGHAQFLFAAILTPNLAETEEEALFCAVSIHLRRRLAGHGQTIHERQIGKAQAAIVSRVFAERQFAIQMNTGNGTKCRVFVNDALLTRLEGVRILLAPPVAQIARRVELPPFIVESMSQFVPDYGADCPRITATSAWFE
jgi:hypothetical protein